MRERLKKPNMGGLFALLLFGVFAVCIMCVLFLGADAYQSLTQRGQESYNQRTAAQYITTRVHQSDCLDTISVESFGNANSLKIAEDINGTSYVTRIYCYDGYICELFSDPEAGLIPSDGEKVMPAQGLEFTLTDQLLYTDIKNADGSTNRLAIYLRSREEAGL